MANILTIIRIIGIFPLCFLILKNGFTFINFILFGLLELTDFLDGYIARKYNKVSNFGKIADGIADKLLMFSITIILLYKNIIPYWTLIIFIREIVALIYAGLSITKKHKILSANIFGKTKTTLHMVSMALVLLLGKWNIYSSILLIIAILLFIPEVIIILKNKDK